MHYQLKAITKEKNKALKVLVETKAKLEKCKKLAYEFLTTNSSDIAQKKQEIYELEENQIEIKTHIGQIDKSIDQTNKILGV